MEVHGYANAADWVYLHGLDPGAWSTEQLRLAYGASARPHPREGPVWDVAPHPEATPAEMPGSFREHDIAPFPGGMQPALWTEVPGLLATWLDETERLRDCDAMLFPELLAELHARFEQIHPFLDGNGRTGRLVLNLSGPFGISTGDHLQR